MKEKDVSKVIILNAILVGGRLLLNLIPSGFVLLDYLIIPTSTQFYHLVYIFPTCLEHFSGIFPLTTFTTNMYVCVSQ